VGNGRTTKDRLEAHYRRNGAVNEPSPKPPPGPAPWDPPIPFAAGGDVLPFPTELLPAPVAEFVNDVATALACPPDFVGVPALVVAGAAVGAARALTVKDGWHERPALYAAVVAQPSSSKSPALRYVAAPVYAEQARLHEIYKRELQAHADGAEGAKPKERALFASDITVERLSELLQNTPRGLVIIRDELTGWVASMNQYRARGVGADRMFFLQAWGGEPISVMRKAQQAGPVFVAHPFLAIVGGLPPNLLSRLRGERDVSDGFLDRILFAYPEPLPAVGETWCSVSDYTADA
jgi:hypothetical protein